mmetsp:Transcript_29948/g.45397  ORF Transcript_29948/g.45397 Transcript_29948/m.45397 type:complete len:232 (+) Transcript_29948:94-789(+)
MTIANSLSHPNLLIGTHREKINISSVELDFTVKEKQVQGQSQQVSFYEYVAVRPIKHIGDMSAQEVYNVWYNRTDFNNFKSSFLDTVRMMSLGEYDGDDESKCSRGLEGRTRDGAMKRKMNKYHSRQAVLSEQDRQRSIGVSNDKMISDVYIVENFSCRLEALEVGIQDQYEVFDGPRKVDISELEMTVLDGMAQDISSDEEIDYCHVGRSKDLFSESRRTESSVTDEVRE